MGCAARPVKEMAEAESALIQAQEAQAERYAAQSLKEADEALKKAQEYSEKKEYKKAKTWALESKQKSQIAKEEALWAKGKLKNEAEVSLGEAEKDLSPPEKGKASPPLLRELEFAKETLKRAKFAWDLGNYEEARNLALLAKSQALGFMEAAKRAEEEAIKKAGAAKKTKRYKKSLEELNRGITGYKVKAGETLWIIAGHPEIYDEPLLWPIIYKANRDQIRDPEVIFAEQTLKIPRNITEEQRNTAIKEASEGTWFKHGTIRDKESSLPLEPRAS